MDHKSNMSVTYRGRNVQKYENKTMFVNIQVIENTSNLNFSNVILFVLLEMDHNSLEFTYFALYAHFEHKACVNVIV